MTGRRCAPAGAGPGRWWARRLVAAGLLAPAAGLLALGVFAAAPARAAAPAAAPPSAQDTTPTPTPSEIVVVPGGSPAPTEPPGVPPQLDTPDGGNDPSWWDLGGRVRKAITDWLSDVVTDGIRSTTGLLAGLLHTPDPRSDPRVRQLWLASLVIADSFYLLLVVAGAVILAGHETLQTRYAAAQIAPRLVIGMVASHASLSLAGEIVSLGNALSVALLADRVDPAEVSLRLRDTLESWLSGGNSAFLVLLGLAALVLIVAVGFTVIVRHALILILTAAAPLALACHALPHTEAAARLWWKATTGLLLAQAGQALALVTLERVVLTSGPRLVPFGGITSDLLIVIGLLYVMLRIPGWAAKAAFGHGGGFGLGRLVTYAVVHSVIRDTIRAGMRATGRGWRRGLGAHTDPVGQPPPRAPRGPGHGGPPISGGGRPSPGGGWRPDGSPRGGPRPATGTGPASSGRRPASETSPAPSTGTPQATDRVRQP
ncbi:MAG: hypothetical protein L0Y54_18655, partial [Sporichthyaceae bacterium]|nr:hypothetical protein [Sporichthyaceae bacterium]